MTTPDTTPETTVDELDRHLASGGRVLDVRNPDEYADAHIPGAVLIPLSELDQRLGDVPPDRPVHVVCQSGRRSAQAVQQLLRADIDAVSVTGGTSGWSESGRPTETGRR
ncbi:rhodanese-like domain-containing protein [Actinomycetospora rhizophila]|uniref:Rhodanese-like domain-containing protein n=1 Tax=Actinomycetospora rhizophila TaxID=1416876 RepID=A0ABV9ZL35_9PSEU